MLSINSAQTFCIFLRVGITRSGTTRTGATSGGATRCGGGGGGTTRCGGGSGISWAGGGNICTTGNKAKFKRKK